MSESPKKRSVLEIGGLRADAGGWVRPRLARRKVFCAPPMGHLGSSRAARVRQAIAIFKYSYVVRDSGLQIWPI